MSPPLSVLLLAYGGPERLEDVPDFLERVVGSRRVTPAITERACARYRTIGGGSPLVRNTLAQAEALAARLRELDGEDEVRVFVGMRHSAPFLEEALARAVDFGRGRVVAFIMASHQSGIATGGYVEQVAEAARKLEEGRTGLSIEILGPWHTHPLYLEAVTQRVRAALETLRGAPLVVFSAHSLPLPAGQEGEPAYEDALRETAEEVMARLGEFPWRLAYQSRSPRPGVRWLGPDIREVLDEAVAAGARSLLVVPLGFVVEHLETLYDLDIEFREQVEGLGLAYARTATVQDHPLFVEMLSTLAADRQAAEVLEAGA